jgi:aspartate racemase
MRDSAHFGLIGGLGVGAAMLYYSRIAEACAARGYVPRITMAHAHAPNALALVTAGKIDELADYLSGFATTLENAGAVFIAIPAVTPHICEEKLKQRLKVPLLSMLETTARGLRARRLRRISLFGTRFTIEERFFGALEEFDIVNPHAAEIDEIHRVYLELAQKGKTSAANVDAVKSIAREICRRDGVEAVLIAGTDFNLVFDEETAGFPAFDCAAAHIDAIVGRMTA